MADKVGLKVGIEGEKEFRNSIKDIEASYKLLGSELKLAQAQFDKNDKSIESLKTRNEFLNKELDLQAQKVGVLEQVVKKAAETYGEADYKTKEWAIKLNEAKLALSNTEKELSNNTKEMERVGKETDGSNTLMGKFKEGLDQAKDAAKQAGPVFSTIGDSMKQVGTALLGAAATVGAAAVATGKAVWDMATGTAAHGDEVDKMSQKLGMSKEAYQEWGYALGQSGIDVNSLQEGVKTLGQVTYDAGSGVQTAKDKFAALGITMDDLEGKSREEIFGMTIKALQGVSDETEKAAIANSLLGGSGAALTPILNSSAEATQALLDRAHDLGFVMSDEAVGGAVVFTDSMDDLGKAFQGVKTNIVGNLLPGFSMVIQGLTDLLLGNENAKEKIKAGVAETVQTIKDVLPQIKDTLLMIIDIAAEVIPDIIQAIIEFITENLPEIVQMGVELALKLITGIVSAIPEIVRQLPAIISAIVTALKNALPQFADIGKDIVKGIWEGIKGLGNWLGDQVKGFFGNVVGGIKSLLGIRSPSKVFADIGENMAAGIGVGFGAEMKKVKDDIKVDVDFPDWPTPRPVAGGGGFGGQTIVINNPINLDGKVVSRSTSRHQANSNDARARALGVAV